MDALCDFSRPATKALELQLVKALLAHIDEQDVLAKDIRSLHNVIDLVLTIGNLSHEGGDYQPLIHEVRITICLLEHIPELGPAFLKMAMQNKYDNERLDLLLILCSCLCMNQQAKDIVCLRVIKFDQEIASALCDNVLSKLLEAIDTFEEHNGASDGRLFPELINAFLRNYPHAYVTQNPDSPESHCFVLSNALKTILKGRNLPGGPAIIVRPKLQEIPYPTVAEIILRRLQGKVQPFYI
jgi:hypothetical protein